MTLWQLTGVLLLAGVFAIIFVAIARVTGWREAVLTFGVAGVLSAVVICGAFLIKGDLP